LLFPRLSAADTQLSGLTYRPLSDVAARYGMKLSWVTRGKTIRAQNDYCTLELTVNERSLSLNGQPMALGAPVIVRGDMAYLSKLDFDNNIFPLLSPGQIPGVPSLRRIIVDPGHGGDDPGTVFPAGASPAKAIDAEKTHTLETGLLLAAELRKRGYDVVMTRTKDVTFDRHDRPGMANQAKGDLYVSIHFNQADATYVDGIETWVMTPAGEPSTTNAKLDETDKKVLPGNRFDPWSTIVGFSVQRMAAKELGADNRGVKRRRLDVLATLNMPGLLVEGGFMSNPAERAKIDSADYRQKLAVAIADGIDLYKTTLERLRPGATTPAPVLPAAPAEAPHHPESINEVTQPN
jgi:N-acetylmuramoyl-L-alanine amidase